MPLNTAWRMKTARKFELLIPTPHFYISNCHAIFLYVYKHVVTVYYWAGVRTKQVRHGGVMHLNSAAAVNGLFKLLFNVV